MNHKAETAALLADLGTAGLQTVITLPDGTTEYQLTPDGVRVAR